MAFSDAAAGYIVQAMAAVYKYLTFIKPINI
jgi:hypothetical protein